MTETIYIENTRPGKAILRLSGADTITLSHRGTPQCIAVITPEQRAHPHIQRLLFAGDCREHLGAAGAARYKELRAGVYTPDPAPASPAHSVPAAPSFRAAPSPAAPPEAVLELTAARAEIERLRAALAAAEAELAAQAASFDQAYAAEVARVAELEARVAELTQLLDTAASSGLSASSAPVSPQPVGPTEPTAPATDDAPARIPGLPGAGAVSLEAFEDLGIRDQREIIATLELEADTRSKAAMAEAYRAYLERAAAAPAAE